MLLGLGYKRFSQDCLCEGKPLSEVAIARTFCVGKDDTGSVCVWGTTASVAEHPGCNACATRSAAGLYGCPVPQALSLNVQDVSAIACGPNRVVFGLASGGCLSWGSSGAFPLSMGHGNCGACPSCAAAGAPAAAVIPRSVRGLEACHVVSIAVGDGHSLAVTVAGTVYSWGRNECGQLGLGAAASPTPRAVVASAAVAAATVIAATVQRCPSRAIGTCVAKRIPLGTPIAAVGCGRDFSALLCHDGRLLTCGCGLYGALGHGSVANEIAPRIVAALEGVGEMLPSGRFKGLTAVACGSWHIAALSSCGDLYTWGWDRWNQCARDGGGSIVEGGGSSCGGGGGGDGSGAGLGDRAGNGGRAEVQPVPGLATAFDVLLAAAIGDHDDNELTQVACGARFTAIVSRLGHLYVSGQLSPGPEESNAGGGGGTGGKCSEGGGVIDRAARCIPVEELLADADGCSGGGGSSDGGGCIEPPVSRIWGGYWSLVCLLQKS